MDELELDLIYRRFVTFYLNDECFGIDVEQVAEVLLLGDIAPVPGASDCVVGIINLRGNVLTVVDTRLNFNMKPYQPTDRSRILIVELSEAITVGLIVDRVAEVITLQADQIEPAPAVSSEDRSSFVSGIYRTEKGLIALLSLEAVFANELSMVEREEVANL